MRFFFTSSAGTNSPRCCVTCSFASSA
jgi:hypothetical protein